MKKHNHKLVVPTWTPYQGDGSIYYDAIPKMARNIALAGADIAWVNGTSGESVLLKKEERAKIAQKWKNVITEEKLEIKLFVNVGCECLSDTIELAQHAQQIGCDGIASMGPSFFKPKTIDDLVQFLKKVAQSVPQSDFYYYHYPMMNGINFPLAEILRTAKKQIPNLKGAKVTDVDMEGFDWAIHIFGSTGIDTKLNTKETEELQLFSGFPTLALTGFFQGAAGGFVYDFMVKPFSDMIFAYEKGDIATAQDLQQRIGNCYRHIVATGGMVAAKYLSDRVIVPNGGVRLPLRNLNEEQKKAVLSVIEEYGDLLFERGKAKM